MSALGFSAKNKPVSVARATVKRANGDIEIYYSAEKVPLREFRRWLKLKRHLRFMKREDKGVLAK